MQLSAIDTASGAVPVAIDFQKIAQYREEIKGALASWQKGLEEGALVQLLAAIEGEVASALRNRERYTACGGERVQWRDIDKSLQSPRTLRTFYSDPETIVVQIYGKMEIGRGRFRRVKESLSLIINLSNGVELKVEESSLVKLEASRFFSDSGRSQRAADEMVEFLRRPQALLEGSERINIGCPLKKFPSSTFAREGKSGVVIEWEEPRFSDLRMKGASLSYGELLEGYCSLAERLQSLHSKQIVHLDLQPGNLLFDGSHTLILSDFDYTSCVGGGHQPPGEPYWVWDSARHKGVVLPTCDIFGFALSFAAVVLDRYLLKGEIEIHRISTVYRFFGDERLQVGLRIAREKSLFKVKLAIAMKAEEHNRLEATKKSQCGTYCIEEMQKLKRVGEIRELIERYRYFVESDCEKMILNALQAELFLIKEAFQLFKDAMEADAELVEDIEEPEMLLNGGEEVFNSIPFYGSCFDRVRAIKEKYTAIARGAPLKLFAESESPSEAQLKRSVPTPPRIGSLTVQGSCPELRARHMPSTIFERQRLVYSFAPHYLGSEGEESPSSGVLKVVIDTLASCFGMGERDD